ncbi:hypothetical protein [uncultured Oscillibacter sp.]|uniref:hypothetical protein n=1 Tax=uncultured Oscillibacter sp. TaxID=876091 RepID=UPI002729A92B|nr:hypothetical protein [uncultured Oscillibacter sp.]
MSASTFNIYCMSYKRSNAIMTKHLFEYCTYVVREEEAELYRAAGVDDILAIPKGEVWNFMSTLYWIINNTPEDVIFIADDDIEKFVYRMDDTTYLELPDGSPDVEKITSEVERIAQLLFDLDLGLAFDQPTLAPYAYDREFQFKGMPGHIRWVNKKKLRATYTRGELTPSDVDMALQELMYNRIILQPKYLCVKAFMDKNDGAKNDRRAFLEFTEAMRNKWGKYYAYNKKRNIGAIRVKR